MRTAFAILSMAGCAAAADLPVRQVILFKHGVGFFERAGDVPPNETIRLDFKATEMNDVLKSLLVVDRGGAKVNGVRYDASWPLEEKLAEFPFQIGDQMTLAAFLDQAKGSAVEVQVGTETVTGRIVGARSTPGDEKTPKHETLTLLTGAGQLRTFDINSLLAIKFTSPEMQKALGSYLTAVSGSHSKEKRSLYIDAPGTRGLTASYMMPSPVWKSSYRLLLREPGEPTLEGWAIVDNTTGEDWNGVQLSLVSGRPISFISTLYEPRFVNRPTADLPENVAQAPRVYEGGVAGGVPGGVAGGVVGGIIGGLPAAPPPPPPPAAAAPRARLKQFSAGELDSSQTVEVRAAMPSSAAAMASTQTVGELFEYRFGSPVTVKQNESAMLPFLQQTINARKLLIYSNEPDGHPRNAAELTNSTGKVLDGGPITVFDGGTYGGEGLVETLKANDKRMIGYAIDLGTRITTKYDSSNQVVRELHANRGVLTAKIAAQTTRTYTIRNVDQKAKTLVIEHPSQEAFRLLSPKPAVTTSNYYRFEVKLGPDSNQQLPVAEERVYSETYAISNFTPDALLTYINNKTLSASGRQQLQQIAALKQQLATVDEEMQRTNSEINSIEQDQNRLRQNIASLNAVSGQQQQVQKYAGTLASQEATLVTLRDQRKQLTDRKTQLQREVNSAIEKANF